MIGRRVALEGLGASAGTHAGLWLDQGLAELKEKGAGQEHLEGLTRSVRAGAAYRLFFARWKGALAGLPPHTVVREATVAGRMVVGLGAESILETSIALHRTYGVPYIPGSALKGLAAAAAHRWLDDDWHKAAPGGEIGPKHRVMFGDTESSGYVTFHDALWVPAGDALPLDLDVMTVHHPDYYGARDAVSRGHGYE